MSSLRSVPVVPYAVPETVAYPAIHIFQFAGDTCHSVVSEPTPMEFFQFMDAFVERCRGGFAGDDFDFTHGLLILNVFVIASQFRLLPRRIRDFRPLEKITPIVSFLKKNL